MSRADALIALMLICGIVVKLSGNKASIQIYLVIANQVFGWWFWTQAMPLAATVFFVSALVAMYYVAREAKSSN